MIKNTNNMSLTLSLNILKALGGDTSIQYETVDDVWNAINEIYGRAGDGIDIEAIILNITENGQYDFDPTDEIDAYAPVHLTVNVPQKYTDEQVESLTNTARQEGYQDGFVNGESEGEINQKAKLTDIKITDNGVYETENGYKTVTVAVEQGIPDDELQQMLQEAMDEGYQDGYAEGVDDGYEDGATEQKAKLTSITFKDNGTYTRDDGWNEVIVEVASSGGGGSDDGKQKVYNGFRFTGGDISTIDFSQYDWSNVYDTSKFFYNCYHNTRDWSNFIDNFNGRMLSCYYMFSRSNGAGIYELPNFSKFTDGCVDLSYMCYNANNLNDATNLQYWKTKDVIATDYMFHGCSKLTSVPLFDTSNVVSMYYMFCNCTKLTSVPLFDTSNVVNMYSMFSNCPALTSVPLFDTSNVVNMQYMFGSCNKLTSVPLFDTSNVVNMQSMFSNCYALTTIPQLNVQNVTNVYYMFNACSSLTEIPDMNFKSLSSFGGTSSSSSWLQSCKALTTIGVIDCDSITNVNFALGSGTNDIINLGGFRNLGKQKSVSNTNGNYFLLYAPNLTHQSLLNIFNELYDRASAGLSVLTIKMHANHLALLTDDDIAIATNKGWTIA